MVKQIREQLNRLGMLAVLLVLVTACSNGGSSGSGSDSSSSGEDLDELSVSGSAVKGPMANADVTLYTIDEEAADLKGLSIGSGTTDANAQFQDVVINGRRSDTVFLVEISSNAETIDLVSGDAPAIPVLRTLLFMAEDDVASNRVVDTVYATTLSTFAVDLIATLLDSGDAATFAAAKTAAESLVKSSYGMGILDDVDIFSTAPILSDDEDQQDTLNLRTAAESFAAIVVSMDDAGSASAEDIIPALAIDILDGKIDGLDGVDPIADLSDIVGIEGLSAPANPEDQLIPGTVFMVSETGDVLADEVDDLGSDVVPDLGVLGNPPVLDPIVPGIDADDDGVVDKDDACPADPNGSVDSDGDGVCDGTDVFPQNPNETADSDGDCGAGPFPGATDGDGCGDNSDQCPNGYGIIDQDGDEVCAVRVGDTYNTSQGSDIKDDPNLSGVPAATVTTVCELEGETDPVDVALFTTYGASCLGDSDGDGVPDGDDAFPDNSSEWADFDGDCGATPIAGAAAGDGCGDNSDTEYSYSGTLLSLYNASAFSGSVYTEEPEHSVSVDYELLININPANDAVVGTGFEIDGSFSTIGSGTVPGFAQQTWTFVDAVFSNDNNVGTETVTVTRDAQNRIQSIVVNVVVNGGPSQENDALVTGLPPLGAVLTSNIATSMTCAGGSCDDGTFPKDKISYVVMTANDDGDTATSSFGFEFKSNSGGTAYSVNP